MAAAGIERGGWGTRRKPNSRGGAFFGSNPNLATHPRRTTARRQSRHSLPTAALAGGPNRASQVAKGGRWVAPHRHYEGGRRRKGKRRGYEGCEGS